MNKGEMDGSSSNSSKFAGSTLPIHKSKTSILANIDIQELKSIKVGINRGIPNAKTSESRPLSPLKRKLRSPELLKIHLESTSEEKRGPPKPLFARPDIVVNQDKLSPSHKRANSASSDSNSDGYGSRSPTESPQKHGQTRSHKDKYKLSNRPIFKHYINKPPPYELPPEPEDYESPPEKRSAHSSRRQLYRKNDKKQQQKKRSSCSSSSSDDNYSQNRQRPQSTHSSRYNEKSPPLRLGEYRPPKSTRHHSPEYSRSSKPHFKPHSDLHKPSSSTRYHSPERRPPSSSRGRYGSPERTTKKYYSSDKRSKPTSSSEYRQTSRETSRDRSNRSTKSKIDSRSCSRSPPLRPGEYRPPRQNSSRIPANSSSSRNRRDPATHRDVRTRQNIPAYHQQWYEPRPMMRFPGPHHQAMRFSGPRFPPHPHMRQPPPIIIQYIPVPTPMAPAGPPFGQIIRPPLIYNNRTIPRLVPSTTAGAAPVTTSSQAPAKD